MYGYACVYTHVFVLVYAHNRYEILLTTASSLFALYPCLSFSSEKQNIWSFITLPLKKQKALACCSSYPLPETSHSGSQTHKHMSHKSGVNTICKQILLCGWQVQNPAFGTKKNPDPGSLEKFRKEKLHQVRVTSARYAL